MWEDTGSKAILAMGGAKGATIEAEKKVKDLTGNVSENQQKWQELKSKGSKAMEKLGSAIQPVVGWALDLANAIADCVAWVSELWKKISDSKFGKAVGKVVSIGGGLVGGILGQSLEIPSIETPNFEPINIGANVDTSALSKSGEILSKAMARLDYSSSIYRANRSVTSTPVVNVNSNDGAILQAMQQQNELLSALLNKQNTLEANLYLDGQQIRSRMQTIERRQNRLAGVF